MSAFVRIPPPTANLPCRDGARLPCGGRLPFWLVPGDLLVAAPILAFTAPQKLQRIAVQSANGGLIPWQAGIATRIGRFQFMLGREAGLSFYGYLQDQNVLIPSPGVQPLNLTLLRLRSMRVDLPFLEWRLFRTFSLDQSSGLAIQFYGGVNKPTGPRWSTQKVLPDRTFTRS